MTFTRFSDRIALGYEVADLTAELSAAREEGAKTERTCAELSETLEEEREAKGAAEASLSSLRVFTTRSDTLMGATYVVIAPEHPLAAARCERS